MTTIENVSAVQISALRSEAASAGDGQQVKLCDRALIALSLSRQHGSKALAACIRTLQDIEAMIEADMAADPTLYGRPAQ